MCYPIKLIGLPRTTWKGTSLYITIGSWVPRKLRIGNGQNSLLLPSSTISLTRLKADGAEVEITSKKKQQT